MSANFPPLPGKFCPECSSYNYYRYRGTDGDYFFFCEACGHTGPENSLLEETIKADKAITLDPDEAIYRRRFPFPTMGFWFDGSPERALELVRILPERIYRASVTMKHSSYYTKLVIKDKTTPHGMPLWVTKPSMIVVRYRSDHDREMGTPFSVNCMELDKFEKTFSLISSVD